VPGILRRLGEQRVRAGAGKDVLLPWLVMTLPWESTSANRPGSVRELDDLDRTGQIVGIVLVERVAVGDKEKLDVRQIGRIHRERGGRLPGDERRVPASDSTSAKRMPPKPVWLLYQPKVLS